MYTRVVGVSRRDCQLIHDRGYARRFLRQLFRFGLGFVTPNLAGERHRSVGYRNIDEGDRLIACATLELAFLFAAQYEAVRTALIDAARNSGLQALASSPTGGAVRRLGLASG